MADGVGVNGVAIRRSRRARHAAPRSDRQIAWLLVLPAALLILALSIYPLIYSVWVAFVNYDFQIPGHAFVGLENFREIVNDPIARSSLVNTVILSAACVAVEFALGLLLALAMLERFRGRGLRRSVTGSVPSRPVAEALSLFALRGCMRPMERTFCVRLHASRERVRSYVSPPTKSEPQLQPI